MTIEDWRKEIDEIDRKLVDLINRRATAAHEIGKIKHATNAPIYEPEREKAIHEAVRRINGGPLPDKELQHIFERIIDVMRSFQREEIDPKPSAREVAVRIEPND